MIKILGLAESRLSFKLSNPFPGAMLVSPPIHSLSWIFQGFVPSSYLVFLSGFPTLEASPLWSPFWLQLCMTYSFAWSPVFYYACRIRGISLILFIPPPYNLGDEMDDWKPHHSSQAGGTKGRYSSWRSNVSIP